MKVGCLVNNFKHLGKRCANGKRFAHPTLAFWENLFKQGGFISDVMNKLPGINAVAALHDNWWNPGKFMGLSFNGATNWGTMLPAAVITYGALAENPSINYSIRVDRLFR